MKLRRLILLLFIFIGAVVSASAAPKVDPELAARLGAAGGDQQFGVILTFQGDHLIESDVNAVRSLGVRMGVRMANFPILAVNATRSQIQQMISWPSLRSIYLNAPLQYYMHQTKPLIGVSRLLTDSSLTARNGGMPVSGRGVTIAINDSGIDGSHQDLTFNPLNTQASKTVQNVLVNPSGDDGLIVRTDSLGNVVEGILPPTYVENLINTDTHIGHGTHCAGIAAGTGQASGGLYSGVAPGAKLLGLGSGAILFVLGQVAAFDYIYTNQFLYNIRVVNCSWGNSAVAADPDHPINVASKRLHDERSIVVVFANGNDGPRPNSQNRWASLPWVITAGASTKDGRIAGFSSRGIFDDPTIHPTVLTPGTGGPAAQGFTSAVISARARINAVSTGLHTDAQIPAAFVANYTQISGTSMAAPHLAGIVACILEANPALSPDEVRAIIERTATRLAAYDRFEVGAGLANAHAAVDLAFNPMKPYGNFGYSGKGLSVTEQDGGSFQGVVEANGASDHSFTVPANTRFTFVQLDWDGAVGEDEAVIDNTNVVINDLALTVTGQDVTATSDELNLAALFGSREAIKIEFPSAGDYTARVSASIQPVDQPYRVKVTHYVYDPAQVIDIAALDEATQKRLLRLVYDRLMFAEGGLLRPGDPLTRIELARALMSGARVMQFLPAQASFTDIAMGAADALTTESLKREGIMGVDGGASFGPASEVIRLEAAVAFVRAIRQDAQARQLANATVRWQGQPLTDNAQIPGHLRGYVQIALDRGILQAFPAEVREIAPGQFQVIPGPRFEPGRVIKRVEAVDPLLRLINILFGE